VRIVVVGALGAVGGAVCLALTKSGHEVHRASTRAPIDTDPTAVSIAESLALIHDHSVHLVIHAGGPGDHQSDRTSWETTTSILATALQTCAVPGVLLSTTRVLEGLEFEFKEDSIPAPRTVYAENNARNEQLWLERGGSTASVLRLANFFSMPKSLDSPQAALLPWSLVIEALSSGSMGIRSAASLTKDFVNGNDIARAALALAATAERPSIVATLPGLKISLADFAGAVQRAFVNAGRARPSATFGPEAPAGPPSSPGWLASVGWNSELSLAIIEQAVTEWVGPAA
jgi:nucleoside-diphosphate-sugar epimerase